MHHFGEDMTKGRIEASQFIIEATHHTTGAKVTMQGPLTGVLGDQPDPTQVIDQPFVDGLALEFAHFLREHLNPGAARASAHP